MLDACSTLRSEEAPSVGDLSVCIECAAVLVFVVAMELRLATDRDLAGLPAEAAADIKKARELIQRRRYGAQIATMALNAAAWLQAHPGVEVKVQFNYPPEVFLVQPISQALELHSVVANEAGLELIKALWPAAGPIWLAAGRDEPTVAMVRMAIESGSDKVSDKG